MSQIIYFCFEAKSPVQLQKISDSDYKEIPLLNQIKYLLNLIVENGEIKLTSKGFLPTKIVAELYQQGFIKDKLIEDGISKLYKETDANSINLTRLLIELSGLAKKRLGKLSLTKAGEKALKDDFQLLEIIFKTFAVKFNWAYYDRYNKDEIAQVGYGFSLILLSKYGHEKQLDSFYADKYFKAFPHILDSIEIAYGTLERYSRRCYSIRFFDRFLDYFGLITIEENKKQFDSPKYIAKTHLFDKLIKVKAPINN